MALYTVQQLKDAYFAVKGTDPSDVNDGPWFAAEIIRVQAEIDARISQLATRKASLIANGTERVNQIQTRIDNIEPDAREKMKDIALRYIASQASAQSELDNEDVDL
jgi:hypothetical protein